MLFLRSLRLRLLALILIPLLIVSVGAMTWQYRQSAQSAQIVFEQKLSIMTLAIFRDLLATEGENPVTGDKGSVRRGFRRALLLSCEGA